MPPPPLPPIAIRTMGSDVRSIEQGGGASPTPQMLNVNQPEVNRIPKTETEGIRIKIPGYEGPEEKIFSPEALPTTGGLPSNTKSGGSSRKIILIVVVLALVIGLGAVGYFIYPMIFSSPAPTPTPTVTPTPSPVVAPVTIKHTSYLTSDGATQPVLTLSMAPPTTIAPGGKPVIKEIILRDAAGNAATFAKYAMSIFPEFTEGDLSATFEDDFTAFIYYTESGAWPGLVAKLKAGVSQAIAQTSMSKIEGYASLANLFLKDPGVKSTAGFKNGQINGKPARYVAFSTKDAAINYAFIGNYFLISTSYTGALEAEKRLIVGEPLSTVSAWKNYHSEKYGLEVKYPNFLGYEEVTPEVIFFSKQGAKKGDIVILVDKNDGQLPLKEYWQAQANKHMNVIMEQLPTLSPIHIWKRLLTDIKLLMFNLGGHQ